MTETLPRMKFSQVDDSGTDSRTQLALNAKERLGYDRLARAIAIPDALMFALRKLEIEPLVKSSVEAYMLEKAKPGPWSGPRQGILILVGIALAWAIPTPFLLSLIKPAPDGPGIAAAIMLLVLAAGGIVLGINAFLKVLSREYCGKRTTRKWVSSQLKDYAGNVPEFALDRALRIQAACPRASFSVSQLYEEIESIPRPLPDPFLIVTLGIESYYVDVWDEKEYEAKL